LFETHAGLAPNFALTEALLFHRGGGLYTPGVICMPSSTEDDMPIPHAATVKRDGTRRPLAPKSAVMTLIDRVGPEMVDALHAAAIWALELSLTAEHVWEGQDLKVGNMAIGQMQPGTLRP
jgi:hypothetical protein